MAAKKLTKTQQRARHRARLSAMAWGILEDVYQIWHGERLEPTPEQFERVREALRSAKPAIAQFREALMIVEASTIKQTMGSPRKLAQLQQLLAEARETFLKKPAVH